MTDIVLSTPDEVFSILERALKDASFLDDAQIVLDKALTRVNIRYIGEKYQSTITPGIMKSLLRMQTALIQLYSLQKYGSVRRLTNSEIDDLDILVKVNEGSTDIGVIFESAVEAFKRMTGRQVLASVGIICATWMAVSMGTRYIDYQEEIEKTKIAATQAENTQKMISQAYLTVLEAQRDSLRTISGEDFSSIEINGKTFVAEELKEATASTRVRHPYIDKIYDGMFKVTKIYIEDHGTFIEAKHLASGIVIPYINILAEYISSDDYQWIKDAVDNGRGKPIQMIVVATEKNGSIEHAVLRNFEH